MAFAPLDALKRRFERFDDSTLVVLYGAVPTRLGEVVRFFSDETPWSESGAGVMRACVEASDLEDFPIGSRVLLRVRPEEIPYLNVIRPYFGERKLRTVLWVDEQALDPLLARAPDLMSWVYRRAEVPPRRWPEFAEAGVRAAVAAGVPFAWDGERDELKALLGDVGWTGGTVGLRASMSFRELLRALERPGLPVLVGMQRDVDAWRVRMALARAGRVGAWVALQPAKVPAGMWRLHARQADWEQATKRLREAGWRHPGTMAAWVDLEPERIEEAAERVGQPPVDPLEWAAERVAVGDGPGCVLRERVGDADVATARERIRSGPGPREEAAIALWSEGSEPWRDDASGAIEARLVRCLRCLGEQTPASGSVDAAAEAGLTDVAAELARIRFEHGADARADRVVDWLEQYGEVEPARALAEAWAERARTTNDEGSLAAAWTWLGDLHRALGNGEESRRYYEDGLEIRRKLVEREPGRADLQRDISISYERLGDLQRALGNGEQARLYYEDGLEIRRKLVEREPGRADLQRDLSISYNKLGDLHRALENEEEARGYYEDGLAIARTLVEREPGRADLQRDLSISYERLGDLQRVLGNGEESRRYYKDGLAIRRMLVEREPGRADLQRDLSISYNKLGDLHRALGNGEEARGYYEDGLAIARTLVERETDNYVAQGDLARFYERMAAVDPAGALTWLDDAIAVHRRHIATDPRNVTTQSELAIVLVQFGRILESQPDPQRARDCFQEAYALLRPLRDRGALEAQYHPLVDDLARRIGG